MISTKQAIKKDLTSADEWALSGVSSVIYSLNVEDLEYEDAFDAICHKSLEELGAHAKQYVTQERKKLEESAIFLQSGGWWVSGLDPLDNWKRMKWGQFKPKTPRTDQKGKTIKYESPWKEPCRAIFLDNGVPLFWRNTIEDKLSPIVICEGAKKAGLLLTAGFPSIALPGITMGYRKGEDGELRQLIPELEILANRTIIICFDQDSKPRTRGAVDHATQELSRLLRDIGCQVRSTFWDSREGKGIDDLGLELPPDGRIELVRNIIYKSLPVEIHPSLPTVSELRKERLPIAKLAYSALGKIPPFKQGESRYMELLTVCSGVLKDLGDDGKELLMAWDGGKGEWGIPFCDKLKTIEISNPSLCSLFHVALKHGWKWPDSETEREYAERSRIIEPFDADQPDCKNARIFNAVARKLRGVIRFNELKFGIEVDGKELEPESLRMQLALDYGIQIDSKELANEVCLILAKQGAYHPVVDYFNEVAAKYPANDQLLNDAASKYLGVEGDLYSQYLRKWLIAVVARVFSPGCKMDTVLTLQGGQGTYKSTFFKTLCHDEDWFDDSFSGQISDKDEKLKFHNSLIAEWAELDQILLRRDAAACKNVLTSATDKIRPPYGTKVKSYPRRSVVVSTINPSEFLSDPTGDRRWWVIPITKAIDNEAVKRDRDLIWSAAVHAFRTGEQWHLTPEMDHLREQSNKRFQTFDVWQEIIGGWIVDRFDPSEPFTSLQIFTECLQIPPERIDRSAQNRLGTVLKRLGFDNSTRGWDENGKRPRVWIKITEEDGSLDRSSETPTEQGIDNDPSSDPSNKEKKRMDRQRSNDPSDPSSFTNFPEVEKKSSDPERLDQPQIQKGDRVIPQGKARWIRKGSQPLPKYLIPKGLSEAEEIEIGAIDGDLFHDLTSISRVLELSADAQRIKVMSAGGRKSVFPIEDVVLFQGVE